MLNFSFHVSRFFVESGACSRNYYFGIIFYPVGHLVPKYIRNNSSKNWFTQQFAALNGQFLPKFAEIRTVLSMAFTFNLIDAEKLLNFDE